MTVATPLLGKFLGIMSALSLETYTSNLPSVVLTLLELLAFNAPKFRGSRDPGHAHLVALLWINFVILLRHKLCVKFECSIFNGSRNK